MFLEGSHFIGLGISGQVFDERIIFDIRHNLQNLDLDQLAGVATLDSKRHYPLVTRLAEIFKIEMFFFSAAELEAQTPRLMNPNRRLYARIGCHGVAEAAALAAAGEKATLVIPKTICHKATFALAG